jgi:hypothetical protein
LLAGKAVTGIENSKHNRTRYRINSLPGFQEALSLIHNKALNPPAAVPGRFFNAHKLAANQGIFEVSLSWEQWLTSHSRHRSIIIGKPGR